MIAMRSFLHAVFAIMALEFLLLSNGIADEVPKCEAPQGVIMVGSLARAPKPLQDAIKGRLGAIAEPGEKFNPTDAIIDRNLPARRLIFLWNIGDIWIAATELGGIAYSQPVFAYRLRREDANAVLLEARSGISDNVCMVAVQLLKRHQ